MNREIKEGGDPLASQPIVNHGLCQEEALRSASSLMYAKARLSFQPDQLRNEEPSGAFTKRKHGTDEPLDSSHDTFLAQQHFGTQIPNLPAHQRRIYSGNNSDVLGYFRGYSPFTLHSMAVPAPQQPISYHGHYGISGHIPEGHGATAQEAQRLGFTPTDAHGNFYGAAGNGSCPHPVPVHFTSLPYPNYNVDGQSIYAPHFIHPGYSFHGSIPLAPHLSQNHERAQGHISYHGQSIAPHVNLESSGMVMSASGEPTDQLSSDNSAPMGYTVFETSYASKQKEKEMSEASEPIPSVEHMENVRGVY